MVDMELTAAATAFLNEEAALLDDHLLDGWLGLLCNDVRYVMPSTAIMPAEAADARERRNALRWGTFGDDDRDMHFWLYDEDYSSLNMRVRRLDTGMAHAELPESMTNHVVSNVIAAQDPLDSELVRVRSKFMVHVVRHESNENTFVGSRWDKLRRTDDGLRLAWRYIELAHPVLPRTISIFF
jgi:3-phenylpropionate/cinnamic acid dioxygenase small subunit